MKDENTHSNTEEPNSFSASVIIGDGSEELEHATAVYYIGMASIVFAFCVGIGFTAAIVGLVLAKHNTDDYKKEPERYSEESYKKLKLGRTFNIISLVISGLVYAIFFIAYFGLIIWSAVEGH